MATHTSVQAGSAPKARYLADGVALLVAAIWGGNNVVMKAAMADWVTPLAFNAIRFTLGTLAIMVLMVILEKDWRLPRALWGQVVFLGIVGNAANQVLFSNGLARSAASNAGIISAMIPIVAALIGALTGLDRATPRLWLGTAISFAGILFVTLAGRSGFSGFKTGDLLLLGGTTAWGTYTVFAGPLARKASPLKITAWAMVVASILIFLLGVPDLARQDFRTISRVSWLGLLYAAILSNAIGYGLYVWVVHRIGSTRAAMFNNLSPLVTAICAWLLLDERWRGLQWMGAALVMAGVLMARWEMIMASLRPKAL